MDRSASPARTRGEAAWQRTGRPGGTLLGGILQCPDCGGAIIATDAYRYGYSVHKDRGPGRESTHRDEQAKWTHKRKRRPLWDRRRRS